MSNKSDSPTPLQASMKQALENKRAAIAAMAKGPRGKTVNDSSARAASMAKSKPWMSR